MHNGNDEDAVFFDAVQNAVRETVREATADISAKYRPSLRQLKYSLDRRSDLEIESRSETGFTRFEIVDGLAEFFIRFGMERMLHVVNRSRALA